MAAFFLIEKGFRRISVFETSSHEGGLLQSTRPSPELGLVESAANGLLSSQRVEHVAKVLGLSLQQTQKTSRRRYIFREGQARRWPLTMSESLEVLARLVRSRSREQWRPKAFESLQDWGERVIGDKATRFVLSAAVQGVYALPPDSLSASLVLSRFSKSLAPEVPVARLSPRQKGRLRGTVAPELGMGSLMKGLREFLNQKGVRFHFGKKIRDLSGLKENPDDLVVCATSLVEASKLLETEDKNLAASMAALPTASLCSTTVFFSPSTPSPLKGFGCLFPRSEGFEALGVLFNNFIFEARGPALSETWIHPQTTLSKSDAEIIQSIEEERARLHSARATILAYRIHRWPQALPAYSVELETFLSEFPFSIFSDRRVFFIGNYLGAIGLSRIVDLAEQLAEDIKRKAATL